MRPDRVPALGGELALPRTARVEEGLDHAFIDRQPGRAAIDHSAKRRPVAFAPGGESEEDGQRCSSS
jgi:hypothetical protein